MATTSVPALRHLASSSARLSRTLLHQRRWAQVHDVRVRFLATSQATRSVLEKYRDKLESKARAEGLPDIDSLKVAYAEKITTLRKETDRVVPPHLLDSSAPQQTDLPTPPRSPSPSSPLPTKPSSSTGIPPLSSFFNLEKTAPLPADTLSEIWTTHHTTLPRSLCATIPLETYTQMENLARKYPQFLLPVPHPEQGAEIHFLQWTWDAATQSSTVLFTQLAEYKARGEFATPHTTVTHYKELAGEKEVVLMRGEVGEDRGVGVEDGRWLVMLLQRFYGLEGEAEERVRERRRLLEWFAKGDERFTVERLLEEAERMG